MKKYFLVAAAALMLVGCEKEQSEFTAKDLKNDALPQGTVVGTVKYDAGAYMDANGVIFEENFIAAAGQKVKIEVSNNDYVGGSAGNQTYIAEIGEDGKFSYNLPLGLNPTNVTVSVIPFYAEKKVVLSGKIVSISDALYNVGVTQAAQALTNKDIKTYDFNVTSNATLNETRSQKVTVTGRVLVLQWVKDPDDANNYIVDYAALEKKWNLSCEVTTYDDNSDPDEIYTKTGIQTNTEGEFSFTINLPDNWMSATKKPDLRVYTKAELDNEFTGRYYDNEKNKWFTQDCKVLYSSVEDTKAVTLDNEIVPVKFGDMTIDPELQDKEGIRGIGNMAIDKPASTLVYTGGSLDPTPGSSWVY